LQLQAIDSRAVSRSNSQLAWALPAFASRALTCQDTSHGLIFHAEPRTRRRIEEQTGFTRRCNSSCRYVASSDSDRAGTCRTACPGSRRPNGRRKRGWNSPRRVGQNDFGSGGGEATWRWQKRRNDGCRRSGADHWCSYRRHSRRADCRRWRSDWSIRSLQFRSIV
jgi:hypothetical protein